MADQVEIRLPKTQWAEGSGFTATANFRTRSTGAASTPTTVHYRVDCLTTLRQLADDTSVSTDDEVSIPITATHNAIQSDGNEYEVKQLTVIADQGLSTQHVQRVTWRVDNLFGSP
jgi:hypothetical protein